MTPVTAANGAREKLTLNGIAIVDTRDGSLARNMTIVMEAGKITIVRPAGAVAGNVSGRWVDARGKFAVPGYFDLHAHPLNSSDPEGALTLMLANGITGFRQMSGTPATLEARRAGKLMPPIPAPELLEMAGEILTRANAATPESAVAEIRRQHEAGADFIKVIDVGPDVFFAVAAETKRLGLRFLGHLNPTVSPADAAAAGMRSIEHLGPRDSVLLSCSSDESALRDMVAQQPAAPAPPLSGPIPESVIRRAIANPVMFTNPAEIERYRRVAETFSESKCRELAERFVAEGMWQVPTLIRLRTQVRGDDRAYRDDPNLRYIPPATRDMWEGLAQEYSAKFSAEARDALERLFELQLKIVKPFKEAGVKMMAGSDSGGSAGWTIPGFSLHQEFDLLAQCGLSPLDVLQLTTLNGAEFLGRESSAGHVAVGKDANLVVLEENPMKSVQHLHGIHAVVRDGVYYGTGALDAMKQKTEALAGTLPPPAAPPGPSCC